MKWLFINYRIDQDEYKRAYFRNEAICRIQLRYNLSSFQKSLSPLLQILSQVDRKAISNWAYRLTNCTCTPLYSYSDGSTELPKPDFNNIRNEPAAALHQRSAPFILRENEAQTPFQKCRKSELPISLHEWFHPWHTTSRTTQQAQHHPASIHRRSMYIQLA